MQRLAFRLVPIITCLIGAAGSTACSGSGDTGASGAGLDAAADALGTGANGSSSGGSAGASSGNGGGVAAGGRAGSAGNSGSSGTGQNSGGTSGTSAGGSSGTGAGTSGGGSSGTGAAGSSAGSSGQGGAGGASAGGGTSDGGPSGDAAVDGGVKRDGGAAGSSGAAGAGGAGGADAGKPCSSNADCDDALFCDGVETCVSGHCQAGTTVSCPDDGVSCTAEFCNESTKQCESVPQDTACLDSTVCNGTEKCDPKNQNADKSTGCVPGVPLNCADTVACTTDACDPTSGCVHTPNDSFCSNQNACDGIEKCDPLVGCRSGTAPPPCDDSIACTTDSCDPATGFCTFKADDAKCSNGLFCDGVERCDPSSGCLAGTPVACPNADGIACTVEKCDEASDSCPVQGVPDSSLCSSGQVCTASGCVAGKACTTSADCSDGLFCTGVETCVSGICQGGTPVNCDDGVDCTVDSCDETANACKHVATNSLCDDKNVCNGTETCDAVKGCQFGTKLVCPDDGFSCTEESCVPGVGCKSIPNDSICDDGKLCDGVERCAPTAVGHSATTGCVAGTPVTCPSDGIACTTEVCDDTQNGCIEKVDNTKCPCGQTCDVTKGCGNFCVVRACAGKVYQCGDCLDNDGDCAIDSNDPECLGACQNNENGFKGDIPGQNSAPCKMDCYFDNDTGAGNDDCYWTHECDPHEIAPKYDPEGKKCSYDPNASVPGSSASCTELQATQSATCHSICGPLTPNGCDCFGCCAIPGAPTTVYLGSEDSSGNGTCTLSTVGDPTKCRPCLQVSACLNPCDHCELCVGKTTLPSDCQVQTCPAGRAPCGLATDPPCGDGEFCVTGCCEPLL